MGKRMTAKTLLLAVVLVGLIVEVAAALQALSVHAEACMLQGGDGRAAESGMVWDDGPNTVEYKGICLEIPEGWNRREHAKALPFVEGADAVEFEPADSCGAKLVISGNAAEGPVDDSISGVRFALGRADLRMNGSEGWRYLRSCEIDAVRYVRDYPACKAGYEVEGPDGRVYRVSCIGVSSPGNQVFVTSVCPVEGCSDARASLDSALASVRPSACAVDTSEAFERLLFGIRFSLPSGFVRKPGDGQPMAEGCYRVDYGPAYGGGIAVSMQSFAIFGKSESGVSPEDVYNELVFRSGRLQNTFGLSGEDGRVFLRYVDEGETEVAGVRSWETVYEYADGEGDEMRVYQVAMALEDRSVNVRLECPVDAADYCGELFQGIVGSIGVVDDLGYGYEVRQTGGNGAMYVGNNRVFTGIARFQADGYGRAVAYLEMPGNVVVKDGSNTVEQGFRLGVIGDEADEDFMGELLEHEGERVAVAGSLADSQGENVLFGAYQISGAHLAGVASDGAERGEFAGKRDTAVSFSVDVLARGELRDGVLAHKEHGSFRRYVDKSSELYEFGDDKAEPSVLYQGGSLNIAADATVADEVGNTVFVDVDCRTYTGEGSAMLQHVTELAVVLNDDGLVQEAYYN